MKIYYYFDRAKREALNSSVKDYTPAYIPVILKNMGFTAHEASPDFIENGGIKSDDALIIGCEALSESCTAALKKSASDGAVIIAFSALGEGLFPAQNKLLQGKDHYTVAGYFCFEDSSEPLPVLGSFGEPVNGAYKTLGSIKSGEKEYSALLNSGSVYYFTFDLAATLLYSADGRPTDNGVPPFPYGRVPDSCVLEDGYDYDIAFADSYTRFLGEILRKKGFAGIFELEPKDGKSSDLMLYFAGDDDACSAENNMLAAKAMHDRGLPYHLNLTPCSREGGFVIDTEQFKTLHEMNVETALHYNFLEFPYTEEGFKTQADMYEEYFCEKSLGPVNHCLIQIGSSAERCRRQHENGAIADNNRFQNKLDPDDINAFNLKGFAFGSAFPRFVIDDAEHSNEPIDFCEVYNSYYEPRIKNGEDEEYKKITDYIDEGLRYGRTLQLFTHPHYISGVVTDAAPALRALDFAMEYVRKQHRNVVPSGPDHVAFWWHYRAACRVNYISEGLMELISPEKKPVTLRIDTGVTITGCKNARYIVEDKTLGDKPARLLTVIPENPVTEISFCKA